MSFLLDTNILSAQVRRPTSLAHRFIQHAGRLYASSIALAELFVWAHGRSTSSILDGIDELLAKEVNVLDYDQDCGDMFGRVRVHMRRSGLNAPTVDLMVASVALCSRSQIGHARYVGLSKHSRLASGRLAGAVNATMRC